MATASNNGLSPSKMRAIKVVAMRVANSPLDDILDGIARTDGKKIWLPFKEKKFGYPDLIGIAAHEGSHVRFKSIFDPSIPEKVCPENPSLGFLVLNLFEDTRVDYLLKETYPGFWMELKALNKRIITDLMEKIAVMDANILSTDNAYDFLIKITYFLVQGQENLLLDPSMRNEDGKFKFAMKLLGEFWTEVKKALEYLYSYPTFHSTVIVASTFIEELKKFVDRVNEKNEDEGKSCEECQGKGGMKGESSFHQRQDTTEEQRKETALEERKDTSKERHDKNIKQALDNIFEGNHDTEYLDDDDYYDDDTDDDVSSYDERRFAEKKNVLNININSGIPMSIVPKKSRSSLNKLKNLLEKRCDINKIKEIMSKDIKIEKNDIITIVINTKKRDHARYKDLVKTEIMTEDNEKIKNFMFENAGKLKELNNVNQPEVVYKDIVNKNKFLTSKLKKYFSVVRKRSTLERGTRSGIIYQRDLPRVIASKGIFNRPFMQPTSGKGAQLIILIDESGSMRGKNIEMARNAAIILAESLKDTRIKYAIVGFSAVSDKLEIAEKIYKRMDERPNPEKIGTIGLSNEFVQNRDGTSFLAAAKHHFEKGSRDTRMMIVISDGIPCHNGTRYTENLAKKNTGEVINKLKQTTKMFALSIDQGNTNYLEKMYGKKQYIVLKNTTKLTEKLIFLVKVIAEGIA
jgi:hypothetical protein